MQTISISVQIKNQQAKALQEEKKILFETQNTSDFNHINNEDHSTISQRDGYESSIGNKPLEKMSDEEYKSEEEKDSEDDENSFESSDSSRGPKDVRRRKGP